MKYDNFRAFEKHLEHSTPRLFSSIYLILGKPGFENKEAVDLLIRSLLPDSKQHAFCFSSFDGGAASIEAILLDLQSISFLFEKKVVLIQQVDKLKKDQLEKLEPIIEHSNSSFCLILTASQLNKNGLFYKKIEKAGVVLELAEIKFWDKEKKLIEWVGKQAAAARKLMSYPSCQYLVKQIGGDQLLLQQELEKLLCYVGERTEITLQDIMALCLSVNQETIWQLGEAIFKQDRLTALRISRALIQEGQPFLPFLRQIRNQFQTDYQICTLLACGKHASDIIQEFPYMKGQILEKHIQMAQHYGLQRFKAGLLMIDQIEMQSKNSQIGENILTDLLIARLTQ